MTWIFEQSHALAAYRKSMNVRTSCARKFVIMYDLSGYRMKFSKYKHYTKGWFGIARENYPEVVSKVNKKIFLGGEGILFFDCLLLK